MQNYYNDEITEDALYWAAIQGMLRHISPPKEPELAKIWTAEEYEKIYLSRQGNQVSIGIKSTFNSNEGRLTVTEVLPNSPADSILKPFDHILRVDSHPLKGKTLQELNALLEGKEGSEVNLTINRDVKIFDVTLTRRKFKTETLIISRLTDEIALVEIKQFAAKLSDKLKDELAKLKDQGFQKLIIDLRNNPGGFVKIGSGPTLPQRRCHDHGLQTVDALTLSGAGCFCWHFMKWTPSQGQFSPKLRCASRHPLPP